MDRKVDEAEVCSRWITMLLMSNNTVVLEKVIQAFKIHLVRFRLKRFSLGVAIFAQLELALAVFHEFFDLFLSVGESF